MPSYATCHIFAATVQRVTSDAGAHIIDSAPSAYRWGAQGVSPLRMYHAPLPSPLHHAAAELRHSYDWLRSRQDSDYLYDWCNRYIRWCNLGLQGAGQPCKGSGRRSCYDDRLLHRRYCKLRCNGNSIKVTRRPNNTSGLRG